MYTHLRKQALAGGDMVRLMRQKVRAGPEVLNYTYPDKPWQYRRGQQPIGEKDDSGSLRGEEDKGQQGNGSML